MHRFFTRRSAIAAIALLPLAGMMLPAQGASAHLAATHAQATTKVGLVLDTGGRDDKGFNQLAYEGAVAAKAQYGVQFDYVQTTAVSDALYYANLSKFARDKYNLVIGVGFLMQNSMYKVAKAFPSVKFALIDGAPTDPKGNSVNLPSVANLLFREQESGYLVGYMAGLMEKGKVGVATHGVIGTMGGISIPPVNRYIAGYIQGAHAADPAIKVKLAYVGDFISVAKAQNIGLGQVAAGADILFAVAGGAGNGYLKAAQIKGLYGIGVDADQSFLGSYMMTSAVKKVDRAVQLTIGSVKNGTFKGGDNLFTLKNNATGYGVVGKMVPASIQALVKAQAKLIAAGKIVPTTVIPKNM